MDRFVQFASGAGCTDKSLVMDYYDGNTVTALWNYAQRLVGPQGTVVRAAVG
jgi:phospholipase C